MVSNTHYTFKKMRFIIKSNLKRLFFTHKTFNLLNFFKIFTNRSFDLFTDFSIRFLIFKF
ncbi:hypothetical protein HPNQ4161_0668 [Helicobacter pylori NQ4161]|nr:hypothetical protein HPNQ4161_0668 [Helicobacter pylori NQ4161]